MNKVIEKMTVDQIEKILQLLEKAQSLGLNFDIGNAYIRREYIDKQNKLNSEINAIFQQFKG
tara:strand:+ start:1109 stop:1294 length:186 start_codon:yes stop_codon:yes gene_type:complete